MPSGSREPLPEVRRIVLTNENSSIDQGVSLRRLAGILVVVGGLLGVPQTTAAQNPCNSSPAAYDRGGKPHKTRLVNDPLFTKQWGLKQINAPGAWEQGALGARAIIAIVDSGVDLRHPDLRRNLMKGTDIVGDAPGQECPGPQDPIGHGTHVAGIAAAVGDNRIGVVGVAPRARIMPVRVIRGDEQANEALIESSERVADGIRYAANHGADVINLSLSTFWVTDNPLGGLSEAVEFAWRKGAVIVAAAGNDEDPICKYPAADPLVICVASTTQNREVASSSNAPFKPTDNVAVLAPGGQYAGNRDFCNQNDLVISTFLTRDEHDCGLVGYATLWGTSLAAPHVSGIAALLSGRGLNNEQIVNCLLQTASNNGVYDSAMGYGIVNAAKAVRTCS